MNFERGQDPKKSMGIGIQAQLELFKQKYHILANGNASVNDVLQICAAAGKLSFVKYLVEHEGADPHAIEEHCLRWAAKGGFLDVVKYLVEECHADIAINNYLAFRWAKEEGHIKTMHYLLQQEEHKRVRESLLEFERGLSPKVAMGIGNVPKIKEWLKEYRIHDYKINDDGTIDANNVRLNWHDINEFPPYINFNMIHGDFLCSRINLKTLRGFPKIVKGDLNVSENKLKSLRYAPDKVGGVFNCSYNHLRSLEFAPKSVYEFDCEGNTAEFTKEDVKKYCNAQIIVETTSNSQYLRKQKEERKAKAKLNGPVAQRKTHNLGTKQYNGFKYTEYTKGYKGFKIYEFIRNNGPVTAEQVGRFAHEMSYGNAHDDGTLYNRNQVTGHGLPYIDHYGSVNSKVIKVKKGKFKYLSEYKISPIGEAFLDKNEKKFNI